jgi:hypothetical protein
LVSTPRRTYGRDHQGTEIRLEGLPWGVAADVSAHWLRNAGRRSTWPTAGSWRSAGRRGRMAVAPSPPTWRLARSGPPPSGASQPGAAATPTTVRHRDFYRADLVHAPIQLQPPGRSAGVQPAAPYRRSARSRSTVASSWTVTSAAVMAAHSLSSHGVALAVLPARSPAVRPAAAMTMIDIDPVTTMRRRGLPAGFAVRRQTRVLLAGHRRGFSLAGPEYRGSRACRPGHHSARRPLPSHAVAGAP